MENEIEFYIARNGTQRQWRYTDAERPGAVCYDCRAPYEAWEDIVLPHDVWERINPTEHRGCGLLCANCIFERLHHLRIYEVSVS